ncbi:hypothetical protein, partial [Bacillus thuringiensis]
PDIVLEEVMRNLLCDF